MRRTLHTVVEIPIVEGGEGSTIPILILKNGAISHSALAWARDLLLEQDISPSTLLKAINALGRMYDFYEIANEGMPLAAGQTHQIVKKFFQARRRGNELLGWPPVLFKTAADDVRVINTFSDWCTANLGYSPLNPKEQVDISELSDGRKAVAARHGEKRKEWDMLYHLYPSTARGKGKIITRPFIPKSNRSRQKGRTEESFPPHKVAPLINVTGSIRDRLYFLLLFYGGVRVSEPLHLFTTDVRIQPNGIAKVTFGHPAEGVYQWTDRLGRRHHSTRAAYLQTQYGLGPRSRYGPMHPLHSGWKGMMEDDGVRRVSYVTWIDDDAGRLFSNLHTEYMRLRANMPDTHPYYFVSLHQDKFYGQPLKHSNITKAFERAMHRVGLTNEVSGAHVHGARHYYGYYCASILRLPLEVTQKIMHHAYRSSTEQYYHISNSVVRDELIKSRNSQQYEIKSLKKLCLKTV